MWRPLAALRIVSVGYALVVGVLQRTDYDYPAVAWVALNRDIAMSNIVEVLLSIATLLDVSFSAYVSLRRHILVAPLQVGWHRVTRHRVATP